MVIKMSVLSNAVQEVLHFLSGQESLSHVVFCEEYPAAQKDSPLRRVTVAIGLGQTGCTPDALGGFLGEREGRAWIGYPWTLRIRLQIHAPNRMGAAACRKAFEHIWESLLFDAPFPITAAGCGTVAARRETGSLELEAWIEREVRVCRAEGGGRQ